MKWVTGFAIWATVVGFVGTVSCIRMSSPEVRERYAQPAEGDNDTFMNRYMYSQHGAFAKRITLVMSVVLMIVGVCCGVVLLATGNWGLD